MCKLAFLLALTSFPAGAADFRAIDVGQSCDTVQAWELAHGSIPIPSHTSSGASVYAYTADEYGQHIVVTYLCKNGTLFTGNREFPVGSWSQAVENYRKLYESLRSEYGVPAREGHPWDDRSDQQEIAEHWIRHMTVWRVSEGNVMLTIQPNQPFKPELPIWRVCVAAGK